MRILHIANHVKETGNGIVNVMVDLACEQAARNHQVGIISAGGQYEELIARYNIRHYNLDQTRKPAQLMRAVFDFRRIVADFSPDIIHAHMMTGALLARYLKGFRKYKIVTHVHNEFQKSADFMRVGDRVIAVSQAVSSAMAGRGVRQDKLRVILNGTIGSPRNSGSGPVPLQGRAIVTVAGMYERKGISDLIDAFDLLAGDHPQARLYIVGDGPDRARFEERAAASPFAGRITFAGFQAESRRWMKAAEVFVLASHKEPFGLVLIEARESGCAIVATDVDGIPEALDHGEAGILVPPGDVRALSTAIGELLANEAKRQHYRARAGTGLDYYRVGRVAEEILRVYDELLGEASVLAGAADNK
ncbi:glycosyltransferase involved in cell wall biosynthesis [Paenibacillus forsythiae]|uniref:Glycosyltransferase involved in cell wall biosynthesis n=1 Tax=Paenibacillus forsythiae TaxID=365616 RepID=A0ABU3HC77_9BACL|nr:glycosyltransferase family 4 protein [Paenibacillus forsythiae]MDT3427290.1 glycosyltransferase involved in cell wall biosynthesis [Paenibacillus forsythiae]